MSRVTVAARDRAAVTVKERIRWDREKVPRALVCVLAYVEEHLSRTVSAGEV
jgi:hypothetical protein